MKKNTILTIAAILMTITATGCWDTKAEVDHRAEVDKILGEIARGVIDIQDIQKKDHNTIESALTYYTQVPVMVVDSKDPKKKRKIRLLDKKGNVVTKSVRKVTWVRKIAENASYTKTYGAERSDLVSKGDLLTKAQIRSIARAELNKRIGKAERKIMGPASVDTGKVYKKGKKVGQPVLKRTSLSDVWKVVQAKVAFGPDAKKTPTKKPAAKKTPAKKTPAKKTPAKKIAKK
jgi:hypothetical protein